MSKISTDNQANKPEEKAKYKIKNWSEYNKALVNRGNISLYIDEQVLESWYDEGPAQRGGAYDKRKCWDPLQQRNIRGIIPPQVNANYWCDESGELLDHERNKILKQIDKRGRKKWKKRSGYHRRRKVFKQIALPAKEWKNKYDNN